MGLPPLPGDGATVSIIDLSIRACGLLSCLNHLCFDFHFHHSSCCPLGPHEIISLPPCYLHPSKYLWPMSQSALVSAGWACWETCLFHLASEGSPFRRINHVCCSSMTAHQFLNNLPHFFVTHAAQENPLCLPVSLHNKKLMEGEFLLPANRAGPSGHSQGEGGVWSVVWLSYLGCGIAV